MEEKIIAPDYIEPIIGWRFWRVFVDILRPENAFLRSTVLSHLWPQRKKMAAACFCRPENSVHSESPAIESQCGIYAYKSSNIAFGDMDGLFGNGEMLKYYAGAILGKVRLWGKVQQHQFGYRAQFAYPYSFVAAICNGCFRPFFLNSDFFVFKVFKYKIKVQGEIKRILSKKIFCEKCWEYNNEKSVFEIMGDEILKMLQDGYGAAVEEREKFSFL